MQGNVEINPYEFGNAARSQEKKLVGKEGWSSCSSQNPFRRTHTTLYTIDTNGRDDLAAQGGEIWVNHSIREGQERNKSLAGRNWQGPKQESGQRAEVGREQDEEWRRHELNEGQSCSGSKSGNCSPSFRPRAALVARWTHSQMA